MDRLQAAGIVGVFLGVALLAGYTPASASGGFTAPAPDFVDHAGAAGLTFSCTHWNKALGFAPRWFIDTFHCVSPVVADFNGDGYPDLFFSNQRFDYTWLNNGLGPQDALFLNNGDGTFRDVTALAGIADNGYSYGAAAVDANNDGWPDLYIAAYPEIPAGFNGLNGPATLFYKNNGDGTFTRMDPASMGLATDTRSGNPDHQWGMAVAAGDYDRDGCIDIFRGNYAIYPMKFGMPGGLQFTTPDTNKLYRGHCDGTFTDVTLDAQASIVPGRTFGASFGDINNDGWPDLVVANDETQNEVYLNDQHGHFVDNREASGAAGPEGSMCVEEQDFNGDGNLDVFMSKYEDEQSQYYVGHGDGTFDSRGTMGDLPHTKNFLGWACPALDYANEGALSLFIANGHMNPSGGEFDHPDDPLEDNGYELPNFLFHNTLRSTGTHGWVDVSKSAGPGLLDRKVSSGAVAGDFDLDGRMSLVVVNDNSQPVSYYKNEAQGLGHWLDVGLRGVQSNSLGVGARVTVTSGALTQMQQMLTGDTLASGSAQALHFGLGGETGTATVRVAWPSGLVQTEQVPVDRPVRIVEGSGVQMDTVAPRVDVQVQGAAGQNGWYTSPALTVSLAAQDRGIGQVSGVAAGSLAYRLDGGPLTAYAAPFTVTGEGAHKLVTYAADNAGNRAWYVRQLRIDSVAPTVSLLDPLEGKAYVQGRVVGDSPTGETIVVAPVETPDSTVGKADALVAGVEQSVKDLYGIALPAPPATLGGTLAGTASSDGRTHVDVTCFEATSGADRAEFRLDGKLLSTDAAVPFGWAADLRGVPVGEHTITATVFDRAGWSASQSITLLVVPSTQDGVLNTVMEGPALPGGG